MSSRGPAAAAPAIMRTPYADWHDDLAWMEHMSGPRWKSALAAEQHYYSKIAHLPAVSATARRFERIQTQMAAEMERTEAASKPPAYIPAAIADADNDFATIACGTAALYAKAYGSQFLTLGFFPAAAAAVKGPKATPPAWERNAVGNTVAIIGSFCYYTTTDATNRSATIERCNLLTGRNREVIYDEKNKWKGIILVKAADHSLFFTVEKSGEYDLYYIENASGAESKPTARLLDYKSTSHVALGVAEQPVYICLKDGKQTLHGCDWPLPTDEYIIINGSIGRRGMSNSGWLIGNYNGHQRLYKWSPRGAQVFYETYGDIVASANSVWAAIDEPLIYAYSPIEAPRRIHIESETRPKTDGSGASATVSTGTARSADGTAVNFLIVRKQSQQQQRQRPTGLIVYGYGSYGIPTNVDKARAIYQPLLEAGWAVAFAFIRGGGDRDDRWSAAGRLYNRQRSIEDFEAVIRVARGRLGVPAERTVITGRSAGGMLVGSLIARNLNGALFKGVFAEVPFLDVLRTMSNTAYPLTVSEQNEFGDPARSLTDFMTALEHSPVNRVAGEGAPAIFVLARTAENDSQVLPYEPLKWIWRLREGGSLPTQEGKLFAFAKGQGHFYTPDADKKARSTDLAIIHMWATSQEVRQKIAAYNIKMANRQRTNRNRSNRNRNRQEGGKRKSTRKSTTRKASRKHRKNTRRTNRH